MPPKVDGIGFLQLRVFWLCKQIINTENGMSRDKEFEQKIEILSQHLSVVTEVLETLILKINTMGICPPIAFMQNSKPFRSATSRLAM